ncbi:hypothetical protein [Cupriavidus pauculus]|uniref:hypothetical protein n=1 Tax=Cupriavidus pauculus TaxID=82633 RepID=UPI00124940E8|nr:hypothetical protein [Cupriavidus pauculus]KAB0596403.1 hypothetical protein F7R19_27720 [Cupriavidus pauculus]UAL03859.1 hypothetical protein K8O84_28485 [Cupriavidus pauculus]
MLSFFCDAQEARRFMREECGWPDRDIDALAAVRPLEGCECEVYFGAWIVWQPCAGCGKKLPCAPDAVADYECDACGYDTYQDV